MDYEDQNEQELIEIIETMCDDVLINYYQDRMESMIRLFLMILSN